MVFTQEEEDILRLMINELLARKKMEAVRGIMNTQIQNSFIPIRQTVEDTYSYELNLLKQKYEDAQIAIDNISIAEEVK